MQQYRSQPGLSLYRNARDNGEQGMKSIIRVGDKTTGGGTVLSGSTAMRFDVIGVAREGDPAYPIPIPGHGRTVIAEVRPAFKNPEVGAR